MKWKLGMKKSWFQMSKGEIPHYDLTRGKRRLALLKGAIELSRSEMTEKVLFWLGIHTW